MTSRIFLSHDSRDKKIATVIADTLSRITLQNLTVWFSSDASPGGMRPGSVWLDEIRSRIAESRTILILLSPLSIEKPWILFEAGFGAASCDTDIIPVCVGINSSTDVPAPLAMYQCYQLVDYESLKDFSSRTLNKHGIPFDEDLVRPVLQKAISNITSAMPSSKESDVELTHQELIGRLENHIDSRFIDLNERLTHIVKPGEQAARHVNYSVEVHLQIQNLHRKTYLEIDVNTTVQDILDNVYFMLRPHVQAFTYLTSWIMRDVLNEKNLVIREVSDMIPARFIFVQNSIWEAVALQQPYSPTNGDHSKWYNTKRYGKPIEGHEVTGELDLRKPAGP